jgi:FKBP-type peptidyl-prolyl cis-trans isomerase
MRSRSLIVVGVAAAALAACGSADSNVDANDISSPTTAGSTTTTSTIVLPTTAPLTKPTVKIPDSLPTELKVTVLKPGAGVESKEGDTVVVNYVGVRSADGTEFDNSYDRGEPFPVENIGQGQVIAGWNQGLLGVQAGSQVQLDIPADLAYGDQPQGDIIQAGDALTFVVDVVSVIPKVDPAGAPDVSYAPATAPATAVVSEDLVPGDGDAAEYGDTLYMNVIAIDPATGTVLQSSWESGALVQIKLGAPETLAGLNEGLLGMKVGGRRQLTLPAAKAYGAQGNPALGVAPDADVAFVIDLVTIS